MKQLPQSPIQAVIFDVGGVLLRTEDPRPRRMLADGFGLTSRQLEDLVFNGESGHAAQRGEVGANEHWAHIRSSLDIPESELSTVRETFFAGDVVDRQLLAFIQDLRPAIRTAIITNAWDDMRAALHKQYKIAPYFDHIVVSAEEGVMKPDPQIYSKALSLCQVSPGQAIFIDDFPENVRAAEKLGMQAIRFRDRDETMRALNAALGRS